MKKITITAHKFSDDYTILEIRDNYSRQNIMCPHKVGGIENMDTCGPHCPHFSIDGEYVTLTCSSTQRVLLHVVNYNEISHSDKQPIIN